MEPYGVDVIDGFKFIAVVWIRGIPVVSVAHEAGEHMFSRSKTLRNSYFRSVQTVEEMTEFYGPFSTKAYPAYAGFFCSRFGFAGFGANKKGFQQAFALALVIAGAVFDRLGCFSVIAKESEGLGRCLLAVSTVIDRSSHGAQQDAQQPPSPQQDAQQPPPPLPQPATDRQIALLERAVERLESKLDQMCARIESKLDQALGDR